MSTDDGISPQNGVGTNDPASASWWGRVRRPQTEAARGSTPDERTQAAVQAAVGAEVQQGARKDYPPQSTLVDAFGLDVDAAADAIVLRGYSGRTTLALRALEFIAIGARTGEVDDLATYRTGVENLAGPAAKYILRIYLTPRLDRYVDFQRSCLIGWRYEASPQRQDAITVWLKAFDENRAPIPYRVIQETTIGPTYANYIGGDLLDDYMGQPGSQGSAWDSRSALYGGGKYTTTTRCGE